MQRSKSWNAVARALLLAAVLLLGSQLCGGADVEGGAEMRPAMVILLPEAAHTAETFSKFLRRAGDSTEWTAAIRQVFHLTLPDAIGATNCTKPGKSVVFLLEVSAGGEPPHPNVLLVHHYALPCNGVTRQSEAARPA